MRVGLAGRWLSLLACGGAGVQSGDPGPSAAQSDAGVYGGAPGAVFVVGAMVCVVCGVARIQMYQKEAGATYDAETAAVRRQAPATASFPLVDMAISG